MTQPREPLRYVGIAGVAAWLSMTPAALAKAIERNPGAEAIERNPDAEAIERNPGWPQPDVTIEQGRDKHLYRGWLPERRPEWETWKAALPGQGKGGGRPRSKA